jgi:hypothetical protein
MMAKSPRQLYESNSTIKYPFSDFHTEDVPNDLVLDMCLSVPFGVAPKVTAISVTSRTFFMALEDPATETAIGHVIQTSPEMGRVYQIECTMTDAFGWVVLGPGRARAYENRRLSLDLDPSVVLVQPSTVENFDTLIVDGFPYSSLIGVLSIGANNPNIKVTVETRDIVAVGTRQCIVLSRDDSSLPANTIYGGLVQTGEGVLSPATSVGGTPPDDDGNIDIKLNGITQAEILDHGSEELGVVLRDLTERCTEADPQRKITHGKCEEGLVVELPLDGVVETIKPQYALPDCGCED